MMQTQRRGLGLTEQSTQVSAFDRAGNYYPDWIDTATGWRGNRDDPSVDPRTDEEISDASAVYRNRMLRAAYARGRMGQPPPQGGNVDENDEFNQLWWRAYKEGLRDRDQRRRGYPGTI